MPEVLVAGKVIGFWSLGKWCRNAWGAGEKLQQRELEGWKIRKDPVISLGHLDTDRALVFFSFFLGWTQQKPGRGPPKAINSMGFG